MLLAEGSQSFVWNNVWNSVFWGGRSSPRGWIQSFRFRRRHWLLWALREYARAASDKKDQGKDDADDSKLFHLLIGPVGIFKFWG